MSLNREQPMRPFLDELADAFEAYEVPDGSIDTDALADGAVTLEKLNSTLAASIPMSPLTDAEIDTITNLTE